MERKIGKITGATLAALLIILMAANLIVPLVKPAFATPIGSGPDALGAYTGPRNGYNTDDNVKASLDALQTKVLMQQLVATQTGSLPNGAVYYVDGATGDDADDGLSRTNAVATIVQGITLSNAAYVIEAAAGNGTMMNVIIIAGGTYTEDIEAFPANCHVIGTGSFTRIQNLGTHTCAGVDNSHFWNISFRGGTAGAAMISVANSSHSLGFHNCIFESQATISSVLYYAGSSSNQIIEDCEIGYETAVANSPDIAIHLYGTHCQRMKIINNRIWSTGVGIQIENMTSGNFLLVKDNVIAAANSTTDQMTIGINDATSGPKGGTYVNNYISAADAIQFHGTSVNVTSENICIGNWVNEAGTPAWQDGGTID